MFKQFVNSSESFFVVLPLFHAFSFNTNFICPMRIGASLQFATSLRTIGEDMRAFRPTLLMALPLLVEKAGSIRTTSQGCYFYTENAEGITNTAGGRELQMLLESHLQAMRRWQDDRYYMHVLDIQLDVCRLTGRAPLLPTRRLSPFTHGLSPVQRLKALLLYLLGIKTLCRIHTTVRRR